MTIETNYTNSPFVVRDTASGFNTCTIDLKAHVADNIISEATLQNQQLSKAESILDYIKDGVLELPGKFFTSRIWGQVHISIVTKNNSYDCYFEVITKIIRNQSDLENMLTYGDINRDTLGKNYGGYFVLGNNIVLNGALAKRIPYIPGDPNSDIKTTDYRATTLKHWTDNGIEERADKPANDGMNGFTGVFDGRGYTISGFKAVPNNGGIFGNVASGATIKNFAVVGQFAESGASFVLANQIQGTIDNVYIEMSYADGLISNEYTLYSMLARNIANASLKDIVIKLNASATIQSTYPAYMLNDWYGWAVHQPNITNVHVIGDFTPSYGTGATVKFTGVYTITDPVDVSFDNNTYWDLTGRQPCFKTASTSYTDRALMFSDIGNSYAVTGIGDYIGSTLNIPAEHNGKPVTVIASKAFLECESIVNVTIPESILTVGVRAFESCSKLKRVTFLKHTQAVTIHSQAFKNCTALVEIVLPENLEITSEAPAQSLFVGCKSLTHIILPNTVTKISTRMFEKCSSLTSIVIPDTVEEIGPYAFKDCTQLQNIIVLAKTPPKVHLNPFEGIPDTAKIYCYASALNAYKDATDWEPYINKLKVDDLGVYFAISTLAQKKHFSSLDYVNDLLAGIYNTKFYKHRVTLTALSDNQELFDLELSLYNSDSQKCNDVAQIENSLKIYHSLKINKVDCVCPNLFFFKPDNSEKICCIKFANYNTAFADTLITCAVSKLTIIENTDPVLV
jgi:hypothetical protein